MTTSDGGASDGRPADAMLAIPQFQSRSVGWLLDSRRQRYGDRPLLIWRPPDGEGRRWTYREFIDDVDRVAGGLRSIGLGPGARVAIHMGNCPEYLLAWLACLRLGALAVVTNIRLGDEEFGDQLRRSAPSIAITDADRYPQVKRVWSSTDSRIVVHGASVVGEDRVIDFRELHHSAPPRFPEVAPHDRACVQFTSGSTSRPKGVVWTHANYLWGARACVQAEGLTADDRHMLYLPLFHANSQVYSFMAALWAGASVVLVPRFSASRFWEVAAEERATWASMIPFALKVLADRPVPNHSFRHWGVPLWTRRWDQHFGIDAVSWWGMTETVAHGIVSERSSPRRHAGIGTPAPGYELRIRPNQPGSSIGELLIRGVRGESVALEYLDDPVATAAAWDSEGWFATGDRVALEPDGWIRFVERIGDVLKVGGENVSAAEIEAVIGRFPGVREAAVVSEPDRLLDEVPIAFVTLTADAVVAADEILEHCRVQLADFKVPRAVHIVDEFPRATLEKVAKAELKRWLVRDGAAASDRHNSTYFESSAPTSGG